VNQNPASPTQPTQPKTLTSALASTRLEYLLGTGGRPETSFGNVLFECHYDAAQLEDFLSRGDCVTDIGVTIHCRTVIGSDLYAAEAVCAFAEKALRRMLNQEAFGKMTVDAKVCQVSCTFARRHIDANFSLLLLLGHRLRTFYSVFFSEDVAKINPASRTGG
jgi:hypothetical protein